MELIMRKSDVNKINALKRKPIHYAALEGHTGIVEVLLDCGAKVRGICNTKLKELVCLKLVLQKRTQHKNMKHFLEI